MSNNLRQIAKDLRSFVKRCKDVHYSDSLLISFLITGLLTIAPKLHADVASEQQEITAQTYDAITDLRQSFMRARKENEKSLKGAQSELVQLLKQGDQVIKSPWASFQFGTGYTNNDWGTTYRGRGGKFLEYYKRDNDLTKYVFDKDKHLYGATNLNIPRNQEPNSLTINPANVHEPYKPYVPERIDNINMPNAVSYNPVIYTSTSSTLTSYVKEAPNASYTLNLPDPKTTVTNAKNWGDIATFDRTNSTIRSYDGWDWQTRNRQQSKYDTDLEGHSATSRGHIENGNIASVPGEVYGAYHGVTNYTWLPQTSGSSGVQYSNLNKPAPNNNAAGSSYDHLNNTYNTPGSWLDSSGDANLSNGNTGYDGVASTFSVPFAAEWKALGHGASSETIAEAIIDYYHNHPNLNVNNLTVSTTAGGNVAGYRTDYNNADTAAKAAADAEKVAELAAGHTYTDAQWWNKYNSTMQVALTNNYYTYVNNQESVGTDITTYTKRRVNITAGDLGTNAWIWFTQALRAHGGGTYDLEKNAATSGGVSARSEVLLTNKTMNTKYLDVHIGRKDSLAGNSYLKAVDGADVTSEDVDVSIYNGNGAAYVTSLGRTGKATITFSNDNTNSIANFDTTNSVQDNGGLTGSDKNVAFNFQDGFSNESGLVSSEVTVAGPVNVRFRGNNNVVYNVISALGKATIINGKGATANDTDLKTDDLMQWGTQTGGRIFTAGNNNVVYNGYAGVVDAASKLWLSDVQMQGNNNIMVNLQGPTTQPYNIGKAGFFNGEIRLQGAFGGINAATNSVAVYAASGQNAEGLDIGSHISGGGGTASKDVTVQTLNVAYQNNATGVSVYTINGTGVSVGDASNTNNITDGLHGTTPTQREYNKIKLTDVSTNHIMGYAGGETDDIKGSLIQGKFVNKASRITFLKDVDSMSKAGRVFVAQDGGEIKAGTTAAKVMVRAAGSEAVIAYADGYQSDLGQKNSAFDSKITTVGKIVAADWLTLNNTDYNKNSADANARAYKNIAAYAVNGGQIDMDGETASTTFAETGADTNTDNSLIFGIGAVAKNRGNVILKNVTIIDNEYGALYARKNSTIEFEGNIVNQNNNSTTGTISASGDGTVNTGTRHAQSISTVNTHTNVSPFYVYREDDSDQSNITFTGTTNIDMYDGVLLTGNNYGNIRKPGDSIVREWDYAKDITRPTDRTEANIWDKAKYRGMGQVTTNILTGNVTIGIINQATEELKWDSNKIGTSGTPNSSFLQGIGNYAGGMTINNKGSHLIDVTLINDKLQIDEDVNVEDIEKTGATATPATDKNDTFNDIKMESTYLTINNGKKVTGDVRERDLKDSKGKTNYQVKNVGLAMGNSLSRWNDVKNANDLMWRKTRKGESGFTNLGTVNFWGGSKDTTASSAPITGLLVNFGTIINGDGNKVATVKVDHGNAIVGTDGSILKNLKNSEIIVTGKYEQPSHVVTNGDNRNRSAENTATGENYGIVGISDTNNVSYNYADLVNHSGVDNSVKITHEDAKIFVEGDQATGIYAENKNDAEKTNVVVNYTNSKAGTNGIDVRNSNVTNINARGIGIALVNKTQNYTNETNAGGTINLTGASDGAFAFGNKAINTAIGSLTLVMGKNDILTGKNGIGIYAEAANINLSNDKFTVETQDKGVGLWGVDDTHVATGANHQKTFQYNYNGASNKNGFAMAFTGNKAGRTDATNDLDIKFTNVKDTGVNLAYERTESKAATPTANKGTYKGIAGILVNTNDANDTVTNRGNIEEDSSSKTNVRAYGAVVNKGTFVNYGKIKLNDSLDHQANQITSEDMKKVNVGIFANSTNKLDTTITNRGDITIGDSTNNKNIGSWAIYGYNVNTDSKEDGSKSKITINRNNYGIYSGDGNVNIKNTKLLVGNDTVLGHVQTTAGVSTAPGAYPISRQTTTAGSVNGYSDPNDLLSGLDKPRELDSAIGVYIDKGSIARDINVSADMDIDRFSFGIVMAEKNGGPTTNVTIGSPTDAPTIVLASNKNAGGQVKSTAPSNPKVPEETKEQGNSVYYYSADTESRGKSYANVSMNGDYNTAYYTKGSMDNYGTIDLRSKYDVDNNNVARGYGNVGIFSANTSAPSTNYGTITTGMSDTVNMQYSAAMAAGRNHYKTDGNFDKTTEEGYIVNKGDIIVKEKEGIGMFATGAGSKAVNYGNIRLEGESAIGMYLDRGAIGENYGEIEGNAQSLKGVVAINGGYIKNYGHINVTGSGSYGIVTDGSRFIVDANGNPTEVLQSTDSRYTSTSAVTAGQTNGKGGTDLYGGTEKSIEEGTSGNPKTTGVGTTITAPDIVPITKVSVDGIDTPIFNIETDAANPGDWAKTVTVSSSIQTGGTRIIDLSAKNEWGNPVWEHAYKDPLSEVTSIGMYVDTSGVRYTNPIDGIQNLPKLGKVDLYFGPEATMYTNSKAIRIGDKVDANGTVTKSNILKPFNDALSRLPGGAKVNVLSGSLTWQVLAKLDSNNQLSEIYMSKVPYHSFAYDNDKSLVNFTNNLDNIYEIAKQESAEKVIFNKLNSLGNGEGHILAQAFDQMRGHIYGGVQQRIKSTSDILTGEMNGLRSDRNVSKDSNKFKAFGQRNEFKTDTAGMPDWYSNAGGFAFVHEDETVRLGQSSGWSAGVVNNYFTFKDLSKSYENQAMAKVGVFKTIPLDANGTFVLSLGGDGFFGRNDMKRRFWVVDQEFRAKASYYSYGAGLNAGLEKAFVINDGFSIVPNVGIRAEYGRFSSIHENGDMALNVKSDDYVSVKPSAGIDFRYSQEVFKNSNLTASLGFAYENEIGKLYDVENEARIVGAWTDYFGIRGDKEDKRGNFKSDLKLGLDNGRFGFNVNTGYDSKGHNFRAGLGLKVLY